MSRRISSFFSETPVTLNQFQATIQYAPTPSFRSEYQEVLETRLDEEMRQDQSNSVAKFGSGIEGGRVGRNLMAEYRPIRASSDHIHITHANISSNTRGRQLQEAARWGEPSHIRNSSESNYYPHPDTLQGFHFLANYDEEKQYYDLGQMIIPHQRISGLYSSTSYTSTFEVLDKLLFDVFLRELMTLGHSDWAIVGHPAVKVIGMTFYGSILKKQLPLYGPKLHVSEDEFSTALKEATSTDNRHQKEGESETPRDGHFVLPDVSVLSIDMTMSTKQVARLNLRIKMNNRAGLARIDPIGALDIQVNYKEQPLIELRSEEDTSLRPVSDNVCLLKTNIDQ